MTYHQTSGPGVFVEGDARATALSEPPINPSKKRNPMGSVKHSKPHTKNKNPDRRNGKAWKQGLPPEKRVAGAPKKGRTP